MHCRKNQATLTADEKARFVAAVIALKASGKYDQYVIEHRDVGHHAHRGPAFLPWHREYLRRFELDLRAIDSQVTLPYWDWSVDTSPLSPIWNADFMGGNGRPGDGRVMTGPFAFDAGNWTLTVGDFEYLRREFGQHVPTLPTPNDVTAALGQTVYDVHPWNTSSPTGFRNTLEGWISGPQLHNRVHVWVGGSMLPLTSPEDPIFFLNHCFVDKLWADWQALHPSAGYVPVSGGPHGHNLNEPMEPWHGQGENVTPANVLYHHNLNYAYDTESICAPKLKFRDDPITLKFSDDKLKVLDDPITLKFRDDDKFKVLDDPITLKFSDDKLKVLDDPITLKFSDDGGTSPRLDPVKNPSLDKPPLSDAGKQPSLDKIAGADRPDIINPERTREPAPFVLSTPHHSMAWARSFPEAHGASIAQHESLITQYEQVLRQINEAFANGQLGSADMQKAEAIAKEYETILAEYQQLMRQDR